METQEPTGIKFFSPRDVQTLEDLAHQQLSQVIYYHWINKAKADEPIKILDHVEFGFIDNTSVFFSASELCDTIELETFDFDEKNKELFEKFGGDLYIQKTEKTNEPIWQQIMQYEISQVLLDTDGKNNFYSDRITLMFGRERITISVKPEGLLLKLG